MGAIKSFTLVHSTMSDPVLKVCVRKTVASPLLPVMFDVSVLSGLS